MCKFLFERADKRLCLINRHENPTEQQCRECVEQKQNVIVGLGDQVARYINKSPLRSLKRKGCKCKERQEYLNQLLPKDPD